MNPRTISPFLALGLLIFSLSITACSDADPNTRQNSNIPDANTPDTNTHDTNIPDTNIPDTNIPDTNIPDTSTPGTNTPDTQTCLTHTDCKAREFCTDDGLCTPSTSCQNLRCQPNERCLPVNVSCVHDCISDPTLCPDDQTCNPETAKCRSTNTCTLSADSCSGQTPHFDPTTCACVACTQNDQCPQNETCSPSNTCTRPPCQTTCTLNNPTTCSGQTPYCADGCCIQCIGSTDCPQGESCIHGTCGPPPTDDDTCDPTDPAACPINQFCNPETKICTTSGNEEPGCGLCNPDCTCPNGLTCDGFACTGCTSQLPPPLGPGSDCPEGQMCSTLTNPSTCLPAMF